MTLLRSWMFIPGNQDRHLAKINDLQADALVFDLEDAVPPLEKALARSKVRGALEAGSDRTLYVRVNPSNTSFFVEDLQEIVIAGLAGIIVPKAAKPEDIAAAAAAITRIEEFRELPIGSVDIVPLIESAQGVRQAYEIAKSSTRVKRLAFGAVDYMLDINGELSPEGTEILFARSQLVVHSRAAGIEGPIDTAFTDLRDMEGLLRDANAARRLGFEGKLVIHPDQIAAVNDIFAPKPKEIEYAAALLAVFEEAVQGGRASVQFNGKMIDYPVAARAQKIVEKARRLGLGP